MRNDLALVFRGIMRAPVTPLLAMAALCVGIAVAAAIFTVVDGVLLRGLPYPDSDRLVLVWRGTAREATARGPLSPPDYLDVRDRVTSFAGAVAAVNSFSATYLPDAGDPEQIQLGVIAGDFFGVIGARPFLGRTLETADDRRIDTRDSSAVGVIVLAHGFWSRALGADPGVPGELQRRRDRLRGGVSGNDRRLVEDGELQGHPALSRCGGKPRPRCFD
jgi:hypothetical protein